LPVKALSYHPEVNRNIAELISSVDGTGQQTNLKRNKSNKKKTDIREERNMERK
jgi:hypothetical protein